MCDHLRDSIEARLRQLLADPRPTRHRDGQAQALCWVLDLIDFGNLETSPDG